MVYISLVIGCKLSIFYERKEMRTGQCKDAHEFGLSLDKHLYIKKNMILMQI